MAGISIPSYVTWANVRRFGKMLPYYICDGSVVQQDALIRMVKGTKDATGKYVGGVGYKNFGTTLRKSLLETEQAYQNVCRTQGGFFKYAGNTLRRLPSEISGAWTAGGQAAATAGKSALWGSVKGAGSALAKRAPLIGSLIYLATEVPNIWRATSEGGVVTGAGEAVKAGIKITGFTAGSTIGAALCSAIPGGTIIGAIVGGMIGDAIGSLIAGKTYTEQKKEHQADANPQAMTNPAAPPDASGIAFTGTNTNNPFANLTDEQKAQLEELQKMIEQDPNLSQQEDASLYVTA